jgi:RimJ/RimL family protein N-acetyltransferase
MTSISINETEDGERIAQLAGCHFTPSLDVCFASYSNDGEFMGGVILTDYNGSSIMIHDGSVSGHWLTRDMLWIIFHYPFIQLGCRSIIGMTPRSNAHALRFALKTGFEYETTIRDCLPGGDDFVVIRMWRDRCRWLKLKPRGFSCGDMVMGA